MAWSFYCADEKLNITAESKEELARKVMEHVNEAHHSNITLQDAMQMVNKDAKQSAA